MTGCPTACPWVTHPDNPAWERCDVYACQIERPKPQPKPTEGNAA